VKLFSKLLILAASPLVCFILQHWSGIAICSEKSYRATNGLYFRNMDEM